MFIRALDPLYVLSGCTALLFSAGIVQVFPVGSSGYVVTGSEKKEFYSDLSLVEGEKVEHIGVSDPRMRINFDRHRSSPLLMSVSNVRSISRITGFRTDDLIDVTDYGARGDGQTDNTSPIAVAFSKAVTSRRGMYFPPGTYLTTSWNYGSLPYANQISIIGAGRQQTTIRQINTDSSSALLTIGSATAKNFTASIAVEGITFDGNNKSQTCIESYDLVRAVFADVALTNCSIGHLSYGGIGNSEYLYAIGNQIGFKAVAFSSLAGGGVPNHISLGGVYSGNSKYGAYIDGGNNILFDEVDIERNGSTRGGSSGGVYVGPNMGQAISTAHAQQGVTFRSDWFEANLGEADIVVESGRTMIDSVLFNSQANQTTYDVHVRGGNYFVLNSTGTAEKPSNIKDEALVSLGNYVIGGYFSHLSLSRQTIVDTYLTHNVSSKENALAGLSVYNAPLQSNSQTQFAVSTGNLAAGVDQASATPLMRDFNDIEMGSGGVTLSGIVGQVQRIWNSTSVAINIYPRPGSDQTIDHLISVVLAPGGQAAFICLSRTMCRQVP